MPRFCAAARHQAARASGVTMSTPARNERGELPRCQPWPAGFLVAAGKSMEFAAERLQFAGHIAWSPGRAPVRTSAWTILASSRSAPPMNEAG